MLSDHTEGSSGSVQFAVAGFTNGRPPCAAARAIAALIQSIVASGVPGSYEAPITRIGVPGGNAARSAGSVPAAAVHRAVRVLPRSLRLPCTTPTSGFSAATCGIRSAKRLEWGPPTLYPLPPTAKVPDPPAQPGGGADHVPGTAGGAGPRRPRVAEEGHGRPAGHEVHGHGAVGLRAP